MKSIKILLVDDEESLRQLVGNALTHKGFQVITASNGSEGIEQAKRHNPHVILTDIMMPIMNGYKMVHNLREAGNNSYIIFLTAKSSNTDLITGFSLEGDDFLTKPFQMPELMARINAGVRLKQTQIELEEANRQLQTTIKERDEIINLIAHDLHNPIKEIESYLNLLESATLTPATVNEACQSRIDNMLMLVNNICEIENIEKQQMNLKISELNLSQLVQEKILYFEEIYKDKSIYINYDIIAEVLINSDHTLVSEIITSILYTTYQIAQTDITAKILLQNDTDKITFTISVQSCLDPNLLPDIFESILNFSKSNLKWNEAFDVGALFGLRLSHKLLTMLNGKLILEMNVNTQELTIGFSLTPRPANNKETEISYAQNNENHE